MELMEVLEKRRAVRHYTARSLDRCTIERLIGAAILAPSAVNLQPWAFAALVDPARIDSYAERAGKWLLDHADDVEEGKIGRELLANPGFTMFYHAPALLLVLAQSSAPQAIEDCCLAAENLLLAARNEDIGSCWIGLARPWLNLPSTKKELSLPADCHVVAPLVLGYPREWPESHGRKRAEIHWM